MSKRKYLTEFGLNIYSEEPVMLSPANLDKIKDEPEESRERLKDCNIYFILKRPRISFVPNSLTITSEVLTGKISQQLESTANEYDFKLKAILPDNIASIEVSQYPHTKLIFKYKNNSESIVSFSYLYRDMELNLPGIENLEVIYIGQAFGQSGERTAIERLSSHSTLQKILADISANQPHMEVLLCLYSFGFHRFIINMDGTSNTETTDNEDKEHTMSALDSNFKRSMRISLAEAAFIRYFEPEYNKVYKTGFPHKRLKMLKKLYEFDFGALIAEASIEEHNYRLYSEKQKPNFHHIAQFDLHDPELRKSFFYENP